MPTPCNPTLSPSGRIWMLSAGMASAAGGLLWILPMGNLAGGAALKAAILVAGFYLADAYPLHIESRGETFTLSISELPLVMGMLFCPPALTVLARCAGGTGALALKRRQRMDKLGFNIALQALDTSLGITLYLAMPGAGTHTLLGDGGAAAIGVFASGLVGMIAVTTVVRLHSGRWDSGVAHSYTRTALLALGPSVCAGLVLAEAIWQSGMSVVPIVVVVASLAVAYRSYIDLRHRHEKLRMVHEFVRSVDGATTSESRTRHLLESTREVMRSGYAELFLLGDASAPAARRWVGDDGVLHAEVSGPLNEDWPITKVATTAEPFLGARNSKDPAVANFLARRGWRDCLLAPLLAEGHTIGVLIVADRTSDVTTFMKEDVRLLSTVSAQVSSTIENGQLVDRLTYDSSHDALTGLKNRTTYQDRLESALARADGRPLAVFLMDLDRFKEVNDTLGHHHGDLLIREVADRLRNSAPPSATVARLGGDEFALLLPETGHEAAAAAAERIWEAVAQPCSLDGVNVDVEASIGIAVSPDHGTNRTVLLKRADMAMYAAKRGHTRVEFYAADRDEYSPRRLALASQVRSAVDNGQMELHYQPQVDMRTGRVIAVEALARWHHPEFGMVSPADFIPLAEQSGAIVTLTHWALETAVKQCATWRVEGLDIEMSVNISMRNLLDDSVSEHVERLLRTYDLPTGALTLEVTESQVMADPERTLPILARLASVGVRLSIDDFGTGYSSLAYLKQLPVAEIKVDRSFIASLAVDDQDVAIVRAIVDLARSLGKRVVAEGIEDEATLHRLGALGCDRVQGYLISRPMPAAALRPWLSDTGRAWTKNLQSEAKSRHLKGLPTPRHEASSSLAANN